MTKLYINRAFLYTIGYSRSVIQDTFFSKYYFVPNWLISSLNNKRYITFSELKKIISINSCTDANEYISFLIDKEILYRSKIEINFKDIPMSFNSSSVISNTILLFQEPNSSETISLIIKQLDNLGCENVQILLDRIDCLSRFSNFLSLFEYSVVQDIEVITNNNAIFSNLEKLTNIFSKYERLSKIHITKSLENKKIFIDSLRTKYVVLSKEDMDFKHCGEIHPMLFKNSLSFFSESQNYNTCLNRKLCIDKTGFIKNCPAMHNTFGNIKNEKIEDVVNTKSFQKLWFIYKDEINVCKDCEFRNMCMDCRAFIKDLKNIYSQPVKCRYNPYICLWQGQDNYIAVDECGSYNKSGRFIPNQVFIKDIHNLIWETKKG